MNKYDMLSSLRLLSFSGNVKEIKDTTESNLQGEDCFI